jgi:DNA-binding NtrC family response regulator
MKILIVDDDPGCRDMLHAHLHRNHELSLLTNGRNALALLADDGHDFDLVLLDLHMPRLSGDKLIQVLNECENLKTRFVVISGVPSVENIRRLPNVVAVLRKPFNLSDLDSILREISEHPELSASLLAN